MYWANFYDIKLSYQKATAGWAIPVIRLRKLPARCITETGSPGSARSRSAKRHSFVLLHEHGAHLWELL